jgi:MYXO-CTERM domain-containing protein
MKFVLKAGFAAVIAAVSSTSHAQWTGLSNYVKVGEYALPKLSPNPYSAPEFEASAVTWNKDTNTLFMLGDGGGYIMQTTLTGTVIDYMKLPAGTSPQNNEFYDPEGLAYIGGGKFVMTEERNRTAVQFTYSGSPTGGTPLQRASTSTVKLATTVGNTGLEGISYDPVTGGYIFVNEAAGSGASQNIFQTQINFSGLGGTASNGSATTVNNTSLFAPGNVGLGTFNDVFALSNVYGGNQNLLVLSAAGTIKEVTRTGTVVGSLGLTGALPGAYPSEGITVDGNGLIYVVTDNGNTPTQSALLVYAAAPVPEPEGYGLALAGLGALGFVARRKKAASAAV